ncbi:hypothetical protein Cgig2_012709 [Carnegiea gigantea]|uniref:Integrase catalytic domain-containing protein n=1 Tax=Carnegiea gigantea TaxID=171969 RepID=A0A9Q1JQ56_9CARY|nr:hypothetical protein Cgig2_012709 [Carnegiea gigantea]
MTVDSGRRFINKKIKEYYKGLGITIHNTLAKGAHAARVGELPGIHWSLRTTIETSPSHTPFMLIYSAKALSLMQPTSHNERAHIEALELLSKMRDQVALKTKLYKARITQAYNRRVTNKPLKPGNLAPKSMETVGMWPVKLEPNWEGPYYVQKEVHLGTYLEGKEPLTGSCPKAIGRVIRRRRRDFNIGVDEGTLGRIINDVQNNICGKSLTISKTTNVTLHTFIAYYSN